MNKEINGNSSKSNQPNSNNNKKIPIINNISLKKHLLKAKTNFISIPSDLQGLEDKSFENLKILLWRKQNSNIPLILPSISYIPFINKIRLVSPKNSIIKNNSFNALKNNYVIKLRNIKINQTKEKNELFIPSKQNKSGKSLNKENLGLKQRLGKYKLKNTENFGNIPYNRHNYDLMEHSSIESFRDNGRTFRKREKNIKNNINERIIKRKNIRLLLLDRVINFEPEGLNQKFQSLSERSYKGIDNNKDNLKNIFFNYKGLKWIY